MKFPQKGGGGGGGEAVTQLYYMTSLLTCNGANRSLTNRRCADDAIISQLELVVVTVVSGDPVWKEP